MNKNKNIFYTNFLLLGYNFNRTISSNKKNDFLQSIRICPLCQAILNELTIDEELFQQHIKAHSHQKRR
jgi:hypothetical protein